MPTLPEPDLIAVAVSDIHLTLNQPACRDDKDWMAVQAHYLQQLKEIAKEVPVLCAGDVFDRWNPPPELINFALRHLPHQMICIPGQHDLPNHRLDQIHRSGYGVLEQAGKIVDITDGENWGVNGLAVTGFAWGREITPANLVDKNRKVALIHRYCWVNDKKFPGAPDESNVAAFEKPLKGYDIAIFGDNHKGFLSRVNGVTGGRQKDCFVLNCGGFIRRKSDEIDYQPSVGLIYSNGAVKRRKLDTSIDVFHDTAIVRKEIPTNMREFVQLLEELGEQGLNFREAVEQHLKSEDIEPATIEIIRKAMNDKNE